MKKKTIFVSPFAGCVFPLVLYLWGYSRKDDKEMVPTQLNLKDNIFLTKMIV